MMEDKKYSGWLILGRRFTFEERTELWFGTGAKSAKDLGKALPNFVESTHIGGDVVGVE